MNRYHEAVDRFTVTMKDRFDLNAEKGDWNDCSDGYLFDRLFDKQHTLELALLRGFDPDQIIDLAADVANYAMMIADNAGRKKASTD